MNREDLAAELALRPWLRLCNAQWGRYAGGSGVHAHLILVEVLDLDIFFDFCRALVLPLPGILQSRCRIGFQPNASPSLHFLIEFAFISDAEAEIFERQFAAALQALPV